MDYSHAGIGHNRPDGNVPVQTGDERPCHCIRNGYVRTGGPHWSLYGLDAGDIGRYPLVCDRSRLGRAVVGKRHTSRNTDNCNRLHDA